MVAGPGTEVSVPMTPSWPRFGPVVKLPKTMSPWGLLGLNLATWLPQPQRMLGRFCPTGLVLGTMGSAIWFWGPM